MTEVVNWDGSCTLSVVEGPGQLAVEDASRLNEEMLNVTYLSSRGEDRAHWQGVWDGWKAYYDSGECGADDYARLVLGRVDGRLVHFSGIVTLTMGEATLLWAHVAFTDPDFQGRSMLKQARELLIDRTWCEMFPAPTYFVLRTPNPITYEAARKFVSAHPDWQATFRPWINSDGELDAIDDDTSWTARRIADTLATDCDFSPQTFVVKDFLGEYGDIYRIAPVASRAPATTAYFQRHVDYVRQDCILAFWRIS